MKRVLCFFCALVLLCFSFSALAVEGGAVDPGDGLAVDPSPAASLPQPLQVEVTLINGDPALEVTSTADPSAASLDGDTAQTVLDTLERIEANTQSSSSAGIPASYSISDLNPEAAEREGLVGVVSGIFGNYTPRTYTTSTYINGELVTGTEVVPGLAGLDWTWLGGTTLFGLMFFCFFKMLGGLWK